jgi:repressor LexA
MDTLYKILDLMWKCGISDIDFCNATGINKSAVTDWKKGKTKSYKKYLPQIASFFNVSVDYLLGTTEWESVPKISKIPVLGVIRAGSPIFADENIEGYEYADVKDPEGYFFLRVKGDSMINAGIKPGSKVLIHQQNCAENGQIVACLVNGDEATLKRFRQQGDTVFLMPENPDYEPIIVPCKDFDIGYAKILGVAKKVLFDL